MDWISLGCCQLAFVLYYNTLDAGFVYDDRRAILTNPDVTGQTSLRHLLQNDFWGTPLSDGGSHGSYRPLCVASYRLNHAFSGLQPWSYHLINVLLHCFATVLVVRVARNLLPPSSAHIGPAVAGLAFAAHPIHTEAVAGVVGRADLAACNFFLLSFLAYAKHVRLRDIPQERILPKSASMLSRRRCHPASTNERRGSEGTFRWSCHRLMWQLASFNKPVKTLGLLSVDSSSRCSESENVSVWKRWASLVMALVLAAAATLCKELGITVLPVCVVYDLIRAAQDGKWKSKARMFSIGFITAGCASLLCWRLQLGGAATSFVSADNPTAKDPSLLTRFYTFTYLPVFNFVLLLWPNTLSFDWSMDAVPRIQKTFDMRNFISVMFYGILFRLAWKCSRALVKKDDKPKKYFKEFKTRQKRKSYHHVNSHGNRTSNKNRCENTERRSYYTPSREQMTISKKTVCNGCRHAITYDHSSACRAMNNNNATHQSKCICALGRAHSSQSYPVPERGGAQAALLISLAFLALPFIPASNAFFYVGFVVAERVLYIPSVGYCLLVGIGAGVVWRRVRGHKRAWAVLSAVVLVAMSARTIRRNLVWRDEESLFRSAVHVNPPRAYGNLGSVLSSLGRSEEAQEAYRIALHHRPNMADVHYNLGILLQSEKRYEEAVKSFERAIFYRPSMALAYVNLGVALVATGQTAEAVSVLHAGARVDGTHVRDRRAHDSARVSALVQLANLHAARTHWNKAIATYHEALDAMPPDHDPIVGWNRHSILTMIADAHYELSQWEEAERVTRAALSAAPAHAPAHLSYARILARNSARSMEAEKWFKQAVYLAPQDANIRHQFGEFLTSQRRLGEAVEQYVRAAQLAPTEARRAGAAARALRDAGRCDAAELWYARAVQLNPQDAECHSNLGAILHLNGKYPQAVASYRQALKLVPSDTTALTNLRRVRTLMAVAAKDNSQLRL